MKENKVYFIGYHVKIDNPNEFNVFPSASGKMGYILSVIKETGRKVIVFSLGESSYFHLSKRIVIDNFEEVNYVSTIGKKNKALSVMARLWLLFQLFVFLAFRIDRKSLVIVYHSLSILRVVKFVYFFKRFKLIYEIEEIYKAAWKKTQSEIESEIKLLSGADGYILVNDLMAEKLNLLTYPSVVCYGEYRSQGLSKLPKNNNQTVLVYAGVIGNEDSDVYLSIKTLEFLPQNYVLKIVGYGSLEEIQKLKSHINKLNENVYGAVRIVYDGVLFGVDYLNYLAKCDIGLSTRLLEDTFSDYTFPSKVLVYLCNNLCTVSSPIKCITKSRVAKSIYFYEEQTPESVAKTIKSIDLSNPRSNEAIRVLHLDFKSELDLMLNKISK